MYGLNSSSSSKKLVISCFLKLEANKNKYSHLMGPVNKKPYSCKPMYKYFANLLFMSPNAKPRLLLHIGVYEVVCTLVEIMFSRL